MKTEKQLIYKDDVIKMSWLDNECEVVTLSDIENMEPVNAVKVVHGTWENEQIGFMYYDAACSVCKSHNNSASNYCPHCGAKMDGVSDG